MSRVAQLPLPFELFIDSEPAPKGSVSAPVAGRVVHTDRSKAFEADIADRLLRAGIAASAQGFELVPHYIAVLVHVEFRIRRPRSISAAALPPFPTRLRDGDEDKLQRALRDGLTKGGLIEDDRLVVGGTSLQRWADPTERIGVMIRVEAAPIGFRLPAFTARQDVTPLGGSLAEFLTRQ